MTRDELIGMALRFGVCAGFATLTAGRAGPGLWSLALVVGYLATGRFLDGVERTFRTG